MGQIFVIVCNSALGLFWLGPTVGHACGTFHWLWSSLHSAPDCSRICDCNTRPPAQPPSESTNWEPEFCAWAPGQTSPRYAAVEELLSYKRETCIMCYSHVVD